MTEDTATKPRVLIVAENTSARFGGEAFLPLHYFRILRARAVEAWLVTHARVRGELDDEFPSERDRIYYIEDSSLHQALWKAGSLLPARIRAATLGAALSLVMSAEMRRLVVRLVRELRVDVVHQPIPVSPKTPSLLYDVGAKVVMGPMNGGMSFPPGMGHLATRSEKVIVGGVARAANLANRIFPGKRRATTLLVANARTRNALPSLPPSVRVEELVENGIDASRWRPAERRPRPGPMRLAFVGRLVDWKAVDLLLLALAGLADRSTARLEIFGDGDRRLALEAQCGQLGLRDSVAFHGFVPQDQLADKLRDCDALVLPSLYECGGAVVLEAMALGLPVIASNWGGPADYLDPTCGILVPVENRDDFVRALRQAIEKLAASPRLRGELGENGRRRALSTFDWQRKVDRMMEIYREAITGRDG